MDYIILDKIIKNALKEDINFGDITTDSIIDFSSTSEAIIIAKQIGILAGIDVARRVFEIVDNNVEFITNVKDSDIVNVGDVIARIKGKTSSMLKAERVGLNFLQHLSGIATKTHEFCKKVEGYNVSISDTRKTIPGLRYVEKYAVKIGGGSNHRHSLSDGVLIKDNHIKAAGSIEKAIELARKCIPHTVKIEVETENIDMVNQAVKYNADIIMLDNMSLDMMTEAVKLISKRAIVEASGNMTIDKLVEVAKTGVDIISVGELTHTVAALDISMRII